MRLPLAGGTYQTRAIAAAAQRCLNWFAETIEDAVGSGKSEKILRQTPGFHLLANLNTHAGYVRGFWSGGGRCFVAVGAWVYEISSAGAVLSSYALVLNDGGPVQMAGNGTQLGLAYIVSTSPLYGLFLINNGSGFVPARFQTSGVVTIAGGVNVTWVSGDQFDSLGMAAGTAFRIQGVSVIVQAYGSATTLTLTAAFPGGGSGQCSTFYFDVWWLSGSDFSSAMEGMPFVINGITYTVEHVISTRYLTLVGKEDNLAGTPNPGQLYNVAWSAIQANLVYEAPGGELVKALTMAYLDGSFYVQRPQGGTPDLGRQVNFSAVNDGTVWKGLDFFTKEAAPDYIQSIFADREQLYLFGVDSSEVWQNDLNTGRPVRIQGTVIKEGSAARYAVVSMQEHIYFLGGSPSGNAAAYRLDGSTPTRISTHAVEQAWAKSGVSIGTAIAWNYLDDGHHFWVICFSTGAWAYDATEKQWHERANWTGSAFDKYKLFYHTFLKEWGTNGQHIVGGTNDSKVYIMDSAFYDEGGSDVKRIRDLPYIYGGQGKRVYTGRVDLDLATGLIPSGAEPTMELSWSDDNGLTYSTPESSGFGLHDETAKRCFWLAQGSAEVSRIPRISTVGQAQTTLIDLQAEVDIGDS